MAELSYFIDHSNQDTEDENDGDSENIGNISVDEENLTPLGQIQKCAHSESLWTRQMAGRLLLQLMQDNPKSAFVNDMPAIIHLIHEMVYDDYAEILKSELIEPIPQIAMACMDFNDADMAAMIPKYIFPLIVRGCQDDDPKVRKTSQTATITLVEHNIFNSQLIKLICPIVLERSYHSDEDPAVGAINFMARLARYLGKEGTERIFLRRFVELCLNHRFAIRKVCAASMGDFCAVVSPETVENILLPKFVELCDDGVWGVRKQCAEVVTIISCTCTPPLRRTVLSPAFEKLLDDQSRWVKMAAYESLGPFISTFANPRITDLQYNQIGELMVVDSKSSEMSEPTEPMEQDEIDKKQYFKKLNYGADDNHHHHQQQQQPEKEDKVEVNTGGGDDEGSSPMDIEEEVFDTVIIENHRIGDSDLNQNEKENCQIIGDITNDLSVLDINESSDNSNSEINNEVSLISNKINNINEDVNVRHYDIILNEFGQIENRINTERQLEKKLLNCDVGAAAAQDQHNGNGDDLDKYNSHIYWSLPIPDITIDSNISSQNSDWLFSNQIRDFFVRNRMPPYPIQKEQQPSPKSKISQNSCSTQNIVPELLINSFQSMTDPIISQIVDNDLSYHCAYSFPAVALTLGKDNWPLLAPLYTKLGADYQWRVRRAVAGSLHEIAVIIGEPLSTKYLAPIFEGFIQDVDQVRIGVLKNMTQFLKFINPKTRNEYLPRMSEFLYGDTTLNWRFRCELSSQLLESLTLWPPKSAAKYLLPVAVNLLQDKVAAVRSSAVKTVSGLIHYIEVALLKKKNAMPFPDRFMIHFAHSKEWQRRQTFVSLCGSFVNALPPETFARDIMPHFLDLSWDSVANVRLVVAKAIVQDILQHEYFADPNSQHNESLTSVLKRLQSDKDRDVRQAATIQSF